MMELNKPLIQCTGAREHFAQPKDKVVLQLQELQRPGLA
jgi:hypothetical protein